MRSRKRSRPLSREDSTYRDDRLFIIATEDTYAGQYFDRLETPRIKIKVLPTTEGRSAPRHVLDRLNDFKDEFDTIDDDQFWLMLDTDHWVEPSHVANFRQVCQEAKQRGYKLAHSNPCFEVWILLHFEELEDTQFSNCKKVLERLQKFNYEKSKIKDLDIDIGKIDAALERTRALEPRHDESSRRGDWPQRTGTHVYLLVQEILPEQNREF